MQIKNIHEDGRTGYKHNKKNEMNLKPIINFKQ